MLLRYHHFIIIGLTVSLVTSAHTSIKRRQAEKGEKVLLRTKRQHCTCLNVRIGTDSQAPVGPGLDPLSSTYKCTCNSAGNPVQQQRELQQILQQVEPMSRCQCGPGNAMGRQPLMDANPLFEQMPEQQQWECHCQTDTQLRGPSPQFFPWNRQSAPTQSPLLPPQPMPQLSPVSHPSLPLLPRQPARDMRPIPDALPTPPPYPEQPNGINSVLPPIAPIVPTGLPTPMGPQTGLPGPMGPQTGLPGPMRPQAGLGPQNVPGPQIPRNRLPIQPIPQSGPIIAPLPVPPPPATGIPPQTTVTRCPCMEVTVNVIRTDSRGNKVPIRTPMCLCEPLQTVPPPITPPMRDARPLPVAAPTPVPAYTPVQTNMLPVMGAQPGQTLLYPDGRISAPLTSPAVPYQPILPATTIAATPLVINDATANDDPPIVPCLMISINGIQGKYCTCSEDYRQCSPTLCCNHKTYRSLKNLNSTELPTTTLPPSTASTKSPSAVDLFMEFVDKFRQHLDGSGEKRESKN
ncbi:unnamed protein product [Bursaphelenchus okinawaensis]|uniref:Uncharacterized protein n=1 Tax=Bursaphelenchus okinawaensis TaxID=465554 RepID=A0A811K449_9BILA|nr:unnamed protein product [Bursaphelenchus okinawaensis]CAG9091937.1 unnamed protein product [Bursaphelenchus okinawaensis]